MVWVRMKLKSKMPDRHARTVFHFYIIQVHSFVLRSLLVYILKTTCWEGCICIQYYFIAGYLCFISFSTHSSLFYLLLSYITLVSVQDRGFFMHVSLARDTKAKGARKLCIDLKIILDSCLRQR